jgi:hypothetical protein
MHDFKRLQVWQKARELAVAIDDLTRTFPRRDRGIVAGQLRRSALSIPSNIAEGCGKGSRKETVRYLQIARLRQRDREPPPHRRRSEIPHARDPGKVDRRGERMLTGLMRNLSERGPHLSG